MPASQEHPAPYRPDFAPVAALMADSTRAVMLNALLAGRPLAAGELGRVAGVSPATASAHLAKLLDGGMVTVTVQGRHRYYRLAGHEIAAVIEAISRISPAAPARNLRQSREAAALDEARTCYDHLAGRAGVALLAGRLLEERTAENPRGSRTRGGEATSATCYPGHRRRAGGPGRDVRLARQPGHRGRGRGLRRRRPAVTRGASEVGPSFPQPVRKTRPNLSQFTQEYCPWTTNPALM
jgi:DNA-binding transcriptional ArsR family regulator